MPRFFCDYCDAYLTHDSAPGRQQHIRGWKHRENFKRHYMAFYPHFVARQQLQQQMQGMMGQYPMLPPQMFGNPPPGFPGAAGAPPLPFRPPPGAPPMGFPPQQYPNQQTQSSQQNNTAQQNEGHVSQS